MRKILNHILFYLLLFISLHPLFMLYIIGWILYVLLYHITSYRKRVVYINLKRIFPEKSETELLGITKKFYKHLADITIETIKGLTISEKNLKKRFKCTNPELLKPYNSKSIMIMSGHYTNWELLILAQNLIFEHRAIGVGRKLSNDTFDKLLMDKRARFGMIIVNAKNIREQYAELRDVVSASLYLSDQHISQNKKHYKTTLFGKETLFAYGAEKFAQQYDSPVFFINMKRIKKGYYESTLKLITDKPNECAHGEIMEKYIKMLEEMIMQEPAYWLWSHKRWKNIKGLYKKPSTKH